MGRLDIRICEARNLPDTQVVGTPDPYCLVRIENQQHKTRVISNCLFPKWEEVFKFNVMDEQSAQIRLEVWNKNIVSDELMGVYTLSISGLKRGLVRDQWVLLQRCKGNAELRVRICALDFGVNPTQEELMMLGAGAQIPMAMPAPAYGAPAGYGVPIPGTPQAAYGAPPAAYGPPPPAAYGAPVPAPAGYGMPPQSVYAPAPYGAQPVYGAPPPVQPAYPNQFAPQQPPYGGYNGGYTY